MSDVDESVHIRSAATNTTDSVAVLQTDLQKGPKSGVLIRRSIDEGIAIWYISQYGMEANELFGGFVSQRIDKQD